MRAALWLVAGVATVAFVGAGCGGSEVDGGSASPTTVEVPTVSDPLNGEWRIDFTCIESAEAISDHLSKRQIRSQIGSLDEFMASAWETAPTASDPCNGSTGKVAFLARFQDGRLALCDLDAGACEVNASYELVDDRTITVDDDEGNLCGPCPVTWHFVVSGDQIRFTTQADAFVSGLWEAAPFRRVG